MALLLSTAAHAATVDDVLESLHGRGTDLKSFKADVSLEDYDPTQETRHANSGTVIYQRTVGNTRVLVRFDKKIVGNQTKPDHKTYLLDGGWLTDRDGSNFNETRRQIAGPNQNVDLFELGKGPFPLPIGQDKTAVHKLFDVTLLPPAKDDPAGTDHLRLKPLPKSPYEAKYASVDIWVDPKTQMPVRVLTADVNGNSEKTTEFKNLVINPALADADFKLPDLTTLGPGWTTHDEPMAK